MRGLRQILEHPTGKTVMTTIQKFQEITSAGGAAGRPSVHPTLSEAANIFVMVDEAHRTQYQNLAANMRQALPNACFLGFTGTPIDKKDRSTLQTFGPYIDTYTIEQAVQDRATVPIFYESRLPELQIIGQTIDQVFDRVFAGRSDDERACARLTDEGQPVEVRQREGVTDHLHPESCAGRCEAAGEALTGARTGRATEHRKVACLECRDRARG